MTGFETAAGELRDLASAEASIPAMRVILFMFGVLAALAWQGKRPGVSVAAAGLAGVLGLSYWLIQIASPFGLGTDETLSRQWAQAGVNAHAQPGGSGFVWGTAPEVSFLSVLATLGVPIELVHLAPQIAALSILVLLISMPCLLIKNRTTAAFGSVLVFGGGLWPGVSAYGSALLWPAMTIPAVIGLGVVSALSQVPALRRWFRHYPGAGLLVLVSLGAIATAWSRDGGDVAGPALLAGATVAFVSPLRAALRQVSASPAAARRLEALCLLATFGGSGLLWWTPTRSVKGFVDSRDRSTALRTPLEWIAHNVPENEIILAAPAYGVPIAALAGRRVLLAPSSRGTAAFSEPFRRSRLMDSALRGAPIARLAVAFSATHLLLGPGEPDPPAVEGAAGNDEPRLRLVLVYRDAEDFRIFRLASQ